MDSASVITGENWWTRRCGGREVLHLALPLIISTGSWSLMHFIDRMFLLWYSADSMASAMPAGMLHWTAISFPIGIASYVNTFVAQYYGAKQWNKIGGILGQGLWFSLATIPIFLAMIPFCPTFFRWAGHDADLVPLEAIYLQILLLGGGAAVITSVQSSFFTGRGRTGVVMLVDVAANLLNCLLDYAWIFGKWGFPEEGIAGAAWATILAQWGKVLVYWLLMRREKYRELYGLGSLWRFDWDLMKRLLWFGGSSGFQFFVEGGAYTLLVMCISALGKDQAAATTLAFTVNNVAFIPMVGIHIAVSTLVGQQLGENRPDLAVRATYTALVVALAYTSIFMVAYLFFPEQFLLLHQVAANEADFSRLQPMVVFLLRFVAVYCLFDALQLVFVGAIKGAGDTLFVLITAAVSSTVAVTIGKLGERTAVDGLTWWWTVATVWICALGLVYWARFQQGLWKKMRVIESVDSRES